ncbi:MAG: hypothetical protein HUJ86_07775 [Synergistes sp.]|nr:hypothetical protein [Synergistes sp.]
MRILKLFIFVLIVCIAAQSLPASALTTSELDALVGQQADTETGHKRPEKEAEQQSTGSAEEAGSADAPITAPAAGTVDAPASEPAASPAPAAEEQPYEPTAAPAPEQNAAPVSVPAAAPAAVPAQSAASLPNIYETALSLVKSQEQRNAVREEAVGYFNDGRRDKAASVIGRALGAENNYSLNYLGKFCLNVLPSAGTAEAQIEFLSGLMRGYSKCGVLVFTSDSLSRYTAFALSRGKPWGVVPANAASASADERLYVGKGLVFIPFTTGTKFRLDIVAKEGSGVTLWKILPEGVNTKSWPGGKWEREITVRGDIKY